MVLGSKPESRPAGLQTPLATDFDAETLTRVTNYSLKEETALEEECEAITSVTCSKKAKEVFISPYLYYDYLNITKK